MINEKYFKQFPELESERLFIRKLTLEDAPDLQLIRSDKKVMTYMDTDHHVTVAFSKNFISKNLKLYEQKKGIFWALIEKKTGSFIGDLAYWKIDFKNSRGQLGYTLKPEYWGKGLMKEALIQVIDFGFNQLGLHSLEADINTENENSRKLLKKLGFKKEAYFRENYYYNGAYLDSEIYSLLKTDFLFE